MISIWYITWIIWGRLWWYIEGRWSKCQRLWEKLSPCIAHTWKLIKIRVIRNIIRNKTKYIWNCQIKLYFSSWSKQCIRTKTKRKSWSWNITCSWVDNSSQWRYAFYAFTRSDWSISWFGCSTKYSPESGWNSCKRQGSTFRSSWVSIQFFFYSRAVDTW